MTDEITIFKAAVYWPRFYKPQSMDGVREHETYGCAFDWAAVPGEVTRFVSRSKFNRYDESFVNRHGVSIREFGRVNQRFAPQIVLHDNRGGMQQLAQLREFMRASNLPEDLLFDGVAAEIALATATVREAFGFRQSLTERPMSYIRAVRFVYTDLIASYDRLCARYFADPTLPYAGPEIR